MGSETASETWRNNTYKYAEAVNAYVARGVKDGWDKADKGPDISGMKQNEEFLPALFDALRAANANGKREDIKAQWPIAHEALQPLLKANGQSVPMLCALPDGSIVARIGATPEDGKVVRISGDSVTAVPDVTHFGRCPNRRYFAIAGDNGVTVTDGWQGKTVTICAWPTGKENVPEGVDVMPVKWRYASQLIPFPDGGRVLLVSSEGIFVLTPTGATRLLPTREQIQEYLDWKRKEDPNTGVLIQIDMEHGAVSKDGNFIAAGCQDGPHYVFDAATLREIAQIGPHSEYPHYALFSSDGQTVAFNACHFYNGATIAVPVSKLNGLKSEHYEDAEGLRVIEPHARVYAGVSRGDEFILGDAYGYLRAVGTDGTYHWQHFIGSTMTALDISEDGRMLIAATYAGYISIIELDAGRQQPYQIGNGNHFEHRRWLFWKGERQPLAW